MGNNCVPFERRGSGNARRRNADIPVYMLPGTRRTRADSATAIDGISGELSPAQYAFLSGVLAILSEHGEEALTRSCRMVIERFSRSSAS